MTKFCFALLLLLFPACIFAQVLTPNPDWRFENFNGQNHFTSYGITNVIMDKFGYIWTCGDGVQRFDGYRTVNYNALNHTAGALRGNYTDVATDKYGQLWVSSLGIARYEYRSGKFIYIDPDKAHKITDVNAVLPQNNYLWFICEYGLVKLDVLTQKITYTSLSHIADPLCTFLVDENTMLVSSREKVYVYHIKEDKWEVHTLIYNKLLLKIYAVNQNRNAIYLGTDHGLFMLKSLADIEHPVMLTGDWVVNDILFMPQDKAKTYLFVATEGRGLKILNTGWGKVTYTYLHDDNNPYSLPGNLISRMSIDRHGRLWMATDRGVSMLDVFNQQLKIRFLNKGTTEELGINRITRDRYDTAKVWMSSYNEGMICVDWKTKQIEKTYNTDPQMHSVYDFAQVGKDRWVLATQKHILEWSPARGVIASEKLPLSDSLGLVCNIRRLIAAGDTACFITTNKGLFRYDLAAKKITAVSVTSSKKPDEALQYILIGGFFDKGILWIASRNGLFSYNTVTHQTAIYRGRGDKSAYFFFDVSDAGNGQIICSTGNGINIFEKQAKIFNHVGLIARLYRPACETSITLNNKVWIGSEAGILNYDLKTKRSERAEHENSALQLFPSSPFTRLGNDIVFGFRNGYAYFTEDMNKNILPSAPVIESILVNNQPQLAKSGSEQAEFSHTDNAINISFTSFLYSDPDHINFKYFLKGADTRWQYVINQRNANYAQLRPGSYTFYVQSGNNNGKWNPYVSSFSFVINPAYWETWWFRALIILAVAFILYRLYLYRVQHILAIERIRERIASDFHDDIGSALSSISIFSEVADNQLKQQAPPEQTREMIGRISFHARNMLDAMDDIIWAVNPQNDHFNDLAVRMREFAIPLLEAKNIHFDMAINEDILGARIKMEARKNIFMIFKECINNIIKHADCTEMKLSVKKVNNQLELVISDNGKGFDIDAKNNRNGLKNMQKRAAEIQGKLEVTTQQGKGTVTRLLVNII
ncbi:MAG TPA: triple tyrosine motif-containing protein [Mucilaginibacter sp.]